MARAGLTLCMFTGILGQESPSPRSQGCQPEYCQVSEDAEFTKCYVASKDEAKVWSAVPPGYAVIDAAALAPCGGDRALDR